MSDASLFYVCRSKDCKGKKFHARVLRESSLVPFVLIFQLKYDKTAFVRG